MINYIYHYQGVTTDVIGGDFQLEGIYPSMFKIIDNNTYSKFKKDISSEIKFSNNLECLPSLFIKSLTFLHEKNKEDVLEVKTGLQMAREN